MAPPFNVTSIPVEIWDIVFEYLHLIGEQRDFYSFALAAIDSIDFLVRSKSFRIDSMSIKWHELPKVVALMDENKRSDTVLPLIKKIKIIQAGPEQWQLAPTLERFVALCRNLDTLDVMVKGGSGWMQEMDRPLQNVRRFVARALAEPDSDDYKHRDLPGHTLFHLEHMAKAIAGCVETLELHGFDLVSLDSYGFFIYSGLFYSSIEKKSCAEKQSPGDCEEKQNGKRKGHDTEDSCSVPEIPDHTNDELNEEMPPKRQKTLRLLPKVTSIVLHDCCWRFPFTLDGVANMKELKISYTRDQEHLFGSERFRQLLQQPPESVRVLTMEFYTMSWFANRVALAKKAAALVAGGLSSKASASKASASKASASEASVSKTSTRAGVTESGSVSEGSTGTGPGSESQGQLKEPAELQTMLTTLFPGKVEKFELIFHENVVEESYYPVPQHIGAHTIVDVAKITNPPEVLFAYKGKQFVMTKIVTTTVRKIPKKVASMK